MAKKCFKYGKNIYSEKVLLEKIRNNAEFFTKKHKITGYDVEKVLGIGQNEGGVDYSFLEASDFDADGNVRPEVLAEIQAEREQIKANAVANGTWMKAPNGNDTNLNEQQWVDVRTKRFQNFFGDWQNDPENASKVVDSNGEPMVVYHGTNAEFNEFKQTELAARFGKGYSFTTNKGIAEIWSAERLGNEDKILGNEIVVPAFLNIRNPFDLKNGDKMDVNSKEAIKLKEILNDVFQNGDRSPYINNALLGNLRTDAFTELSTAVYDKIGGNKTFMFAGDTEQFRAILEKAGYDGILSDFTNEGTEEFAFSPNQIKSATSNAGTYSNKTGRIDFQIPNALPHSNVIPAKTLKEVISAYQTEGKEKATETLKASAWYNSAGQAVKSTVDADINRVLREQALKLQENEVAKKKIAVEAEKAKADAKVKKVKTEYKNRIEEIKANFKDKIQKLKDSNKDTKEKAKERRRAVKDMVSDIKSFLASNKIDGLATPTEINRLIRLASQLSQRRDLSKALDEFYATYLNIQTKAENRRVKDENRGLSADEFAELEAIVTEMSDKGASKLEIENFIKQEGFSFSKAGTLSDAIKSQIEKAINRYNTNQLSADEKLEAMRNAEKESNEILRNRNENWYRDGKRTLIKKLTDRQFVAKQLAKELGMINTYNRIIVALGSSSAANQQFEKAREDIFKGLTREERKDLDILITARRVIAIEENRMEKGLAPINHMGGFSLESSREALDKLKQDLGVQKYGKLDSRADLYFDEFRGILDAMLKNGIISQEQYDSMITVDYQPRMFIEHLLDADGRLMDDEADNFANENAGLKKDMLKGLSDGSIGNQIMNAEWILRLATASRNRQMFQNDVNRTFMTRDFPVAREKYEEIKTKTDKLTKEEKRFVKYFEELDSKIKDNPVIGLNKNGNPEYRYDKTPQGFKKAYYFKEGVRHEFFMENELHTEWHNASKSMLGHKAKKYIPYVSGSRILKFAATGANPAFVIANTPRDFMQTVTFSKEYSDIMPLASIQLIRDSIKGFKELVKNDLNRENLYAKYIQYGGGMDFLHTQGMVKRDNLLMNATEKIIQPAVRDYALLGWNTLTLRKISRYSELMFRVAIFNRSMQNSLKQFNKDNGTNYKTIEQIPDAQTQEDMYIAAAASARSIMDFNQGGTVTKDMESMIPYVNAATQGTRVAVDAFTQRPRQTAMRLFQAATLMASTGIGLSFAMFSMFGDDDDDEKSFVEKYLWAREGISKYQLMNSLNIVTPFKNEKGEYYVIKIAKQQFLAPVTYYAEEMILNGLRRMYDIKEEPQKTLIKNTLWGFNNNITPVNLQIGENPLKASTWMNAVGDNLVKNPIGKASMTYITGYDFFRDQPLDKGAMGKDLPMQLEGIKNDKVEGFYKAYGELLSESPIRTKAMVESFVTSPDTNPWVALMYGGAEMLATDKSAKEIFGDKGEKGAGAILKRLKSETSEFSRMLKIREEKEKEIEAVIIKGEKNKNVVDNIAKKLIAKEMNIQTAVKEFQSIKGTKEEMERLSKRLNEKLEKPDADLQILDIKYSTNDPAVKAYLINMYYPDLMDGSKESLRVLQMLEENELASKAIQAEYVNLIIGKN